MIVTETPAGDSDDEIDIIPPTPISGVVFTAACTEGDSNPVPDSSDLRYSVIEGGVGCVLHRCDDWRVLSGRPAV